MTYVWSTALYGCEVVDIKPNRRNRLRRYRYVVLVESGENIMDGNEDERRFRVRFSKGK